MGVQPGLRQKPNSYFGKRKDYCRSAETVPPIAFNRQMNMTGPVKGRGNADLNARTAKKFFQFFSKECKRRITAVSKWYR